MTVGDILNWVMPLHRWTTYIAISTIKNGCRRRKIFILSVVRNYMPKNISKYYWLCQVGGWIFLALIIFLSFKFDQKVSPDPKVSPKLFQRLALMVLAGILSTHLFRLVIRRFNWLLLPVERVIPKLIIGIICVCVLDGLMRMAAINLLDLSTGKIKLDFFARLLGYTIENGVCRSSRGR